MKQAKSNNRTARRHPLWASLTSKKAGRSRKDRELALLHRELDAERRKNARLTREVSDLRHALRSIPTDEHDRPFRRLRRGAGSGQARERLREEATRRARHYRKGSFFLYLWEAVMESAPVAVIKRLVLYLRRLRVVRIILSVALAVGTLLTVGLLSAVALPFLFFGAGVLTVMAGLRSRRMNGILAAELAGARIRILIPPRGLSLSDGSFFIRNARAMAAEQGVAVLVVTPYLLSPRGLGGRGGFFTARKESDGLFVVRKPYFFALRKQVLDASGADVTVVY